MTKYWKAEGELRGEVEHIEDCETEDDALIAAQSWYDGLSLDEQCAARAWASEWEGDENEQTNTGRVVAISHTKYAR